MKQKYDNTRTILTERKNSNSKWNPSSGLLKHSVALNPGKPQESKQGEVKLKKGTLSQ
jgi:hypothetical protein